MKNIIVFTFCLFALSATKVFAEIQRIIALSPSSVEMLYQIGVGDRIIGTVEHADYPEPAKKIPRLGSYVGVQIERILALKPDMIVAWKSGNKQADLQKLESLGLNLVYVDPLSMKQVSEDMRRLAGLIGVSETAEQSIQSFEKSYQQLRAAYQNKEKVKVFYQLWHKPMRTVGNGSWVQSLIEDCNGINIFHDTKSDYPVVTLESVIAKDPQIIVMASHSDAVESRDSVWKKWPTVSAVKNQQIHLVDGSTLLRAGPRAIEGLSLLCQAVELARQAKH